MDPIGCAASVAALIGLSFKIFQFISKTKKGHSEQEKLHVEIHKVYRVLLSIQDQFDTKDFDTNLSWFRCIDPLFQDGGDIALLGQVLGDIADKLEIESKGRVSVFVKTLRWPIDSSEVAAMIAQIEKIKTNINLALNRANLELSRDTNTAVKQVQSAVVKAYLQEVINWISPSDFRSMQQSPQKRALERTGEWLFKSLEFLGWADRRVPSLWCYGIPGAGKTLLASAAFDKLQSRLKNANTLIAIVFFDFNDKSIHSVGAVLCSLLRQAVEHRMDMTDKVRELFKGSDPSGKVKRPSSESLQSAIKAEFEHVDHVYVILDGLDEIPDEKTRSDVLDAIEALDSRLQLMVSSRPLMDIKNWFYGQTRDHRCRIPLSSGYAFDASYDSDSSMLSLDGHVTDVATYEDVIRIGCEVCQSSNSSELVSYQPACYICQDCQNLTCGDCYDQHDHCVGCNGDKSCIKYLWPQKIEIAAQPDDLELYVQWRIAQSPTHERHFERTAKAGHDLKADIIKAVVENSGQMYEASSNRKA